MRNYRIGDICEINPKTVIKLKTNGPISFIPMNAVSIDGKINTSKTIFPNAIKNYTVFQDGDILFAKITPCMENGKGALADKLVNGYGAGSTEFIVLRPNQERIRPKWFQLFLSQKAFRLYCQQHMTGSAGQKRVPPKFLANCDIPVPSLLEQERIVSRIDELFSQLDASVNELKTVQERLKVYRQAVLKEAFEGKYTKTWRIEFPHQTAQEDFDSIKFPAPVYKDTSGDENEIHLLQPETWIKVRLGDVFEVEVGATPSRRKEEYWNGNIPWVSSGEVHFNTIFKTNECITGDGLNHTSTNIQPVGTVMLAMIGEGKTRGQAALLNVEAAHNQNTAAILVSKTPCAPKYIYYFLMMNYENTRRVGSGNNQKALNKERVRALRFPFPSFKEQALIVQEIESRLSVCDSIEKTVITALQQAEALRQSILKKAFEGRLL